MLAGCMRASYRGMLRVVGQCGFPTRGNLGRCGLEALWNGRCFFHDKVSRPLEVADLPPTSVELVLRIDSLLLSDEAAARTVDRLSGREAVSP